MTPLYTDILIHFLILLAAMVVIGLDLMKVLNVSEASSKNFVFPFLNIINWLRFLKLPKWFVFIILQGYWLPLWWVNTLSILVLFHAVFETCKWFKPIKYRRQIMFVLASVFTLLFWIWPEYHRYFLLVGFALSTGILVRLKGIPFRNEAYHASTFNFKMFAIGQFKKNKAALISLYILISMVLLATYADMIANQHPFYAQINGEVVYPIYESHINEHPTITIDDNTLNFDVVDWKKQSEHVVMTLIPYSPGQQDKYNRNFKGPREEQLMKSSTGELIDISNKYRHHMGTDKTGRDVFSGLIHASRISLSVGFISMGIAAFIGVFLGALGGFYGDYKVQSYIGTYVMVILGVILGFFYSFVALEWSLTDTEAANQSKIPIYILKAILFFGIPYLFWYLSRFLRRIPLLNKPVRVPIDALVLRSIEILNAVPRLLLIIVIAATFEERSLFLIMVIIGLTSWTGIARFTRAELLRIRELNYIESAQAMGYSDWRIIFKHALPNALAPVFVSIAFGVAAAILIESSLSFLNIGVPDDVVTWGSMLNAANSNWEATWMVLFPGLAIFITITVYNLIGEGLRDALDPKLKK